MRISFVIGLLLVVTTGTAAQAAVQVVPFRIEETRVAAFANDKVTRTPAALKLTLSLSGPEAEAATKFGNVRFDEAVDDKGTNLIPAKDSFHDATKFREYSNAFFRASGFDKAHPAAPQVELDFAPASRAAVTIARLRGSLEIADAGTVQTIELGGLKDAANKALAIPAAAHVGITVTAASGKNVRSLQLAITGDESALESLDVVDASGRKVSNGMSSWSVNGGPAQKSLMLGRELDDSMKLVAKVSTGRNITKVPFDLKDIALP